jgi:hypothetical protein
MKRHARPYDLIIRVGGLLPPTDGLGLRLGLGRFRACACP